ncbi:MAG: translation initiation factor IF-6 [Candidatus Korarchaeota archaeon]|nr:translation initiation factor IF-6 [Candidatus Korarchaeota archaeon]NIU83810.1 hypothetical protein [Candidatus Thorarchaeota archaeon]NIW15224.1 hypothetical protein [Candidatus Thorarchaeota archaeon]NIW53201.1 hypothetical protein [Candidatus Korarchaeota archaeon]
MEERKRYAKIDYRGNWNIGAFGVATDAFAILGYGFREETIKKAENALHVPVIIPNVLFDSLVGSMMLANSNGILLPEKEVDEEDEKMLNEKLKKEALEIKVAKIDLSKNYNALGNLALCLDNLVVFPSEIMEQNKGSTSLIEDTMGAEVIGYDFSLNVPGSALVGTKRGILAHPMINKDILNALGNQLNIRIGRGSINFGSPWVGNGLILNSHGFLAGNKTTGHEMAHIWRILYRR